MGCAADGDCGQNQRCDIPRGVCVDGANGALFCEACNDQTPCAGGMVCRSVGRDTPRNRCLNRCEDGGDCIGGTRCADGVCQPVNYLGNQWYIRPRQASSCEAVLHVGDPCEDSSTCDRIEGDWISAYCAEEGDAANHCTKVCRIGGTYDPQECPNGWSCVAVPSWRSRTVGQCEPQ